MEHKRETGLYREWLNLIWGFGLWTPVLQGLRLRPLHFGFVRTRGAHWATCGLGFGFRAVSAPKHSITMKL